MMKKIKQYVCLSLMLLASACSINYSENTLEENQRYLNHAFGDYKITLDETVS